MQVSRKFPGDASAAGLRVLPGEPLGLLSSNNTVNRRILLLCV